MTIAFSCTWHKTDLYAAMAKRLQQHGIESCFIITSARYERKLLVQGFAPDRILRLDKKAAFSSPTFERDLDLMREIEAESQETVRNFMLMDRYVCSWSAEKAERYAAYVTAKVHDFLDRMGARVVLGEPSVLHDLIAVMICQATNRDYVGPFGVRMPYQRFVFWNGYVENEFHTFGARIPAEVNSQSLQMARQAMEDIVVQRIKPRYFYKNGNAPKVTGKLLFKMTRGVHRAVVESRSDANMYSLGDILFKHKTHLRPVHYAMAKVQWSKIFDQPILGEKFVLFTLHKQPEYSIDVQGSRFANQYETIKALARALPTDTLLYVKEHRNSLGDRSPKELKRLKAIPGVRLIDPMADANKLAEYAECVVTVSGTIALEAALHGKRTLVLTNQYMAGFSTTKYIEGPWRLTEELRKPKPVQDLDYDLQYLAWLLENSFEGDFTDPNYSPGCMSPENVELLTNAIVSLTEKMAPVRLQVREATS